MPRPDEGLIHAWLDGQLPVDEAARIEQLAATDPEWAAAVAEARGLVAASTRILSALDHVPAGVIPQRTTAQTPRRLPWWTKAVAAVVVMVGASVLVMRGPSIPVTTVAVPPLARDGRVAATAVRTPAPAPTVSTDARSTADTISRKRDAHSNSAATRMAAAPVAVPAQALAAQQAVDAAPATVDSTRTQPQERAMVGRALRGATTAEESSDRMRRDAEVAKSVMGGVASGAPPAPASQSPVLLRTQGMVGNVPVARAKRTSETCYRLQRPGAPMETAFIMRSVRSAGDTVQLEPVLGTALQRAWILRRDGIWHGTLSADSTGRGAESIVATPVPCPAP